MPSQSGSSSAIGLRGKLTDLKMQKQEKRDRAGMSKPKCDSRSCIEFKLQHKVAGPGTTFFSPKASIQERLETWWLKSALPARDGIRPPFWAPRTPCLAQAVPPEYGF